MLRVLALLVVAAVPFLAVLALFAWTDRRKRRRRDVEARQIALVEHIHEQLGAVAAPVLRRRRDGWQVRIAVPFGRPALTEALLDVVVHSVASSDGDRRSLEIIVTRQPDRANSRAGAGGLQWESLPCT